MVITTALMLAAELVIWHVSAKLAESERANIKLGWRLAVVPEIESVIEVLHRRWRANLEARPTQETYLVVVYGITFEEQWDFATRQVFAVSIPVWPERPIAAGGSRQRAVPD